jgi:dihydrofolate reductase
MEIVLIVAVADNGVIGAGGSIPWRLKSDLQRLEVTEVHSRPEGDTYFPAIDAADWQEVARVRNPAGPDDSADFSYVTYIRRRAH